MKHVFTLLVLFSIAHLSYSQSYVNEQFTTTPYKITLGKEATNIWHVGKTQKSWFSQPFLAGTFQGNYAITDSVKSYKRNNLSSFVITIDDVFPNSSIYLSFHHTMDTDTLKDGGFLDVSYDEGKSWTNLANDTIFNSRPWASNDFYDKTDTIKGKIPAYSGKITPRQVYLTWDRVRFSQINIKKVSIRFTFKSDSDSSNKGGWAIDNIQFARMITEGLNDNADGSERFLSIYPNPSTDQSVVSVKNNFSDKGSLSFHTSEGKLIKTVEIIPGFSCTLADFNLIPGFYTYRLTAGNKQVEAGKFIMQ